MKLFFDFHYYLYLFISLLMHLYLYFNEKNLKPCKMFNHCSRLIHDREMKNILCARFQSTVSPSNEARNARTQRRNEMHSMTAVNEQKIHAMLSRERLIAFLIRLLILYLLKYIYTFKSTFESLPGV